MEPKFVRGTNAEERYTSSHSATARSELGAYSGEVSMNACLAHAVFPIDHLWMCTAGLGDSLQSMVRRTTLVLKMGVCVSKMWVLSIQLHGLP